MTTDDYIIDQAEQVTRLKKQVEQLRAALRSIADHPHNSYETRSASDLQYSTGVTDGHRCAAQIARDALAATEPEARPC